MPWPLSQDYNEALQNPQSSFSDPELRQGQVVVNALGIPQPCSGNFADVYAVECPSTKTKWAVKCFTREVHGLRERYSEISLHLQMVRLPFTVDFQYLEQGIRIAGRWYPILKMHWVEGATLNAFVRNMLDKPAMLEKLSRIWVRMAHRLREAKLAHCDLQHGNVLLVPDSDANAMAVKLIDYDGMWVPALAKTPSGEVGHSAYQHPQRLRDGIYDPEVDRFPLLAVYCALQVLKVGGRQLWERYDTGDNMLFRQSDFETPARSPLLSELLRMKQPEVSDLTVKLIDAARKPLDQTPHLADLAADERSSKPSAVRGKLPPAGRAAATAAEPNAFQDLDAESTGSRRRRRRAAQSGSLIPWIVAGSVAASAVVGGVLLWGLRSGEQSEKTDRQPQQKQVHADKIAAAKSDSDKKTPQPSDGLPPDKQQSQKPVVSMRTVYLADLPEERVAALSFTKRSDSKLKNIGSLNNLLTHPSSIGAAQVIYNLGKKFSRFKATVGIGDGTNAGRGSRTPLTFRVLGDDKELWKSEPLKRCGDTRDCSVSVAGVERLELRVDCPGDAYCAHAVWAEPRLEQGNPSSKPVLPPGELAGKPPFVIGRPSIKPAETVVQNKPSPPAKSEPAPTASKLPVPDEAARKKATEDIRDIYKASYAELRGADERVALAVKLLKRGTNKSEEAERRFAYLSEARDQAARGGDIDVSLSAIDELTKTFEIKPLAMKIAALELAAKAPQKPDAVKMLLDQALTIAGEAESADDYEPAAKLLRIAQTAASKSGDPYVRGVVTQRENRLKLLRSDYAKIADAVKTLADKPDDAAANLTVGKFECFTKEDWGKGLPMLSRCQDTRLAELSRKEMDNPIVADEQAALGQAWGKFADAQRRANAMSIEKAARKRANHWFYAALPSLGGAEADKIAAQLEVKKGKVRLRPGLIAELFKNQAFEKRLKARLDYQVDFNWGLASPDTKIPADNFSIRWQGVLVPPRTGKYTLSIEHDDGARLKIDGITVIDHWGEPGRDKKEILLTGQAHTLQLEMHDIGAQASMHLRWSLTGGFPEQAIPADVLYHDVKQERLLAP